MSSLGFTPNEKQTRKLKGDIVLNTKESKLSLSINDIREIKDITTKETISKSKQSEKNWTLTLIIFNMFLVLSHLGVLSLILATDFRFPLTFFYTTIKTSVLDNFSCIYDYGREYFNASSSFCSDATLTMSGNTTPPSKCSSILSGSDYQPGISDSGSPLLNAYELTRYGQNDNTIEYIDNIGRQLSKGVLISIELCTLIAHIFYTIIFIRIYKDLINKTSQEESMTKWFLKNGGLPVRWIEYALTASLMTLFISNTSNLFEFFGVLGLTLATFSLMFFGGVVETLMSQGRSNESILLIYIPGLAIFIATWAPILQSLTTSVFQLSCKTYETDTLFSCSEPTCFGNEVPIPIFSTVLLLLFCIFPIVLIFKVYMLSGWYTYLDLPVTRFVKLLTLQPFKDLRILCMPVYVLLLTISRTLIFISFIFGAGFIAWFTLFKHILSPFLPVRLLKENYYSELSLNTLLLCELFYALASATSKIFLAVFFTISFADRDW